MIPEDPPLAQPAATPEASPEAPPAQQPNPQLFHLSDFAQASPHQIFFGDDNRLRPGWGLLLFFAIYFVAMSLCERLLPEPQLLQEEVFPGPISLTEGISVAVLIVDIWILSLIERRPFTAYGLARPAWLRHLIAGAAWGFALLSCLVLLLKSAGVLAFDGLALHGPQIARSGLLWLFAFTLVGFFEESFFRGYPQLTLTRGLTAVFRLAGLRRPATVAFWISALLISFAFGLVHASNSGESPLGLAAAGFIGLVFCLSLWRTGSLWWAIGFHIIWDWSESFIYGVYDSGLLARGRLFATHPQGAARLSGGHTGPEGSAFIFLILPLIAAVILLTLRPAPGSPSQTADIDSI